MFCVSLVKSRIARGEDRDRAHRFTPQIVVAMFSEDIALLPRGLLHRLLTEAREERACSICGGLFRRMNDQRPAPAGRYKGVPSYNDGLFSTIEPIELNKTESITLASASLKDWSTVNPAIFGTFSER